MRDEDHPRVCGKNLKRHGSMQKLPGSPPRVREKHITFHEVVTHCGITPACAGKTFPLPIQTPLRQDHPRVCGKNRQAMKQMQGGPGSPPRVREKRPPIFRQFLVYGITPACAGKTVKDFKNLVRGRDHPRVCGKNLITTDCIDNVLGSPPRVREKH